jgi:hypothetical protein
MLHATDGLLCRGRFLRQVRAADVWTVYDDDGLPRWYVYIVKVADPMPTAAGL